MGELIAGRAVQGIGGSGLYSLAQVCLLEQGPSRPEVVGALVGITLSISFVLGPLLGGAISEWSWRGIFWFNVPFGVVAVLGIYALWPEERRNRYGVLAAVSKIDFLGNTLLAVASILLVFVMQEAGSFVWNWSSPVILSSLITSTLSWALLILWELYLFRRGGQPIQPLFLMRVATARVYLSTLIVTLLSGFIYIALVVKIPERLQIIHNDDTLWTGVHLLPMLGSCAFGSFLGGAVSKRVNLTSQTVIAGSAVQIVGLSLLYGLSPSLGLGSLLGFTAIYGLGVGLSFAACTMIAAIEAQNNDLATAQGAVAQARVFGGALGLAVCTIMFNLKLEDALGADSGSLLGQQELEQVHRSLTAVFALPDDSRLQVMLVYLDAFRDQMLAMIAVAVAALAFSFGTYKSKPRDVVNVMIEHKGLAGRPTAREDVELSSASSVRSLVR
ncbi:hypothetical protein VTK26DRAFT_9250 [Humicola hyalothermophila]